MASNGTTDGIKSWATASSEFSAQWTKPSDVFSILLILGGNAINLALAALAGGSTITPIAFSFGWVAYAISAVLSAISDNRLVTSPPEIALKVINLRSGYQRECQSWLLARLFKTYSYWMSPDVKTRLQLHARSTDEELSPATVVLCVAVYKWNDDAIPGVPARDIVWWSGFFVTALQLGVAAIPFGLHKNWTIFLVTVCGTLLCYASASLPQWRREKWHARRDTKKDIALTLGNGSQHVVVVLGAGRGLDLEDLAGSRAPDSWSTRIATLVLAVFWLVLLITCTGIRTDTWYLLAVGGLGMLHNLVVAGAPRRPAALGLPIEPVLMNGGGGVEVFAEPKVMWTLMKLEEKHEGFGKALIKEFFPGELRGWEVTWWETKDIGQRRKMLQQAQDDERRKVLDKKQKKAIAVSSIVA